MDSKYEIGQEYQKALDVLNGILKSYRYRHYGVGWRNRRRIKRLVPIFENYANQNIDREEVIYSLAKSHELLARHSIALEYYKKLCELDSDNPNYLIECSTQFIACDLVEKAEHYAERAYALAEVEVSIVQRYAGLMIVLAKDDKARKAIEAALEFDASDNYSKAIYTILDRLEKNKIYRPDLAEILNVWHINNYLSDNANVTIGMGE